MADKLDAGGKGRSRLCVSACRFTLNYGDFSTHQYHSLAALLLSIIR
jgi:hypothetical protein